MSSCRRYYRSCVILFGFPSCQTKDLITTYAVHIVNKYLQPTGARQPRKIPKMELRIIYILETIVVMLHISEARPYLINTPKADSEKDEIMAADERPKFMNTNDLSAFQDLDLYSLEEKAEKNKINKRLRVPKSATAPNGRVKRQNTHSTLCIVRSGTTVIILPCSKRD